MALSSVATGLIGAGIGAGGAVAAQIVAQLFSGRRDTKRLEWERARLEHDDELRRQERFLDLKRELYGKYLSRSSDAMIYFAKQRLGDDVSDLPAPDIAELGQLIADISLICPDDLRQELLKLWTLMTQLDHYQGHDATLDPLPIYNKIIQVVMSKMRAELASDSIAAKQV